MNSLRDGIASRRIETIPEESFREGFDVEAPRTPGVVLAPDELGNLTFAASVPGVHLADVALKSTSDHVLSFDETARYAADQRKGRAVRIAALLKADAKSKKRDRAPLAKVVGESKMERRIRRRGAR